MRYSEENDLPSIARRAAEGEKVLTE